MIGFRCRIYSKHVACFTFPTFFSFDKLYLGIEA